MIWFAMPSVDDLEVIGPPYAVERFFARLGDAPIVALVCPAGSTDAPISHDELAFVPYREHGRRGRWLVAVPVEIARHLCGGGCGFAPVDD
jgi:hypothetical protein